MEQWKCNGFPECADATDEKNCTMTTGGSEYVDNVLYLRS